jgi:periplasmic copper chaperone A
VSVLRGLLVWLALATGAMAADVEIAEPWARATPGAASNGAIYLSLSNHGEDTAIIAAASPAAKAAGLHGHEMDGDMMRMRALESVPLPAGETVTFAPGGLHIMLMGLAAPLVEGESLSLTLSFADGSTVDVTVPILGVGAMGPAEGHGGPHRV